MLCALGEGSANGLLEDLAKNAGWLRREFDRDEEALEQAKVGHGQIVGVMGEPGARMSRLFHEYVGAHCHTPSGAL